VALSRDDRILFEISYRLAIWVSIRTRHPTVGAIL
jgi:hypothetical protein